MGSDHANELKYNEKAPIFKQSNGLGVLFYYQNDYFNDEGYFQELNDTLLVDQGKAVYRYHFMA